jgi:cholesterol oxidase
LGRRQDSKIRFDVQIKISELSRFLKISQHEAELSGTVTCDLLGGRFTIFDGSFSLFSLDPDTGMRQMVYCFRFRDTANQIYYFHGHKEIQDDPGKLDLVEDMTRLFVTVYRGENEQAPIYGAGEVYFKLSDGPSLVSSIKVLGASSLWQKAAAYSAFISFAYGALRDEYLKDIRIFYDTKYENLVLSGLVRDKDDTRPFFLVSGMHDKGFPWKVTRHPFHRCARVQSTF